MSLLMFMTGILFLIFGLYLMVLNSSLMLEWVFMMNSSSLLLLNFYIDWMSVMFFSFIAMISSSVLFYSDSYMPKDLGYRGFLFLVLMFVLSMFFMVFSLNLMSMMLGWDGLGIISYILVVFYKNEKSSSAGMLTIMSNRVGDAALLLSISCFLEMGSWNYLMISHSMSEGAVTLIILAAITKSAQIPFSAWLPAAMAAPTPVSALVHSSTLVTAGVYLLIRFSDILQEVKGLKFLVYLGILTTLMASIGALVEPDFKKVVALSTLSQLGIMIMTLSLGLTVLAFIHLLTHAVFKALLFMCSGKVIHSVNSSQDIRSMGGGVYNLPITNMVMVLSSYALCGVPFLAGFYSKDLIMEVSLMNDNNYVNYCLFMMMVGLSASYSFRLLFMSSVSSVSQKMDISSDEEDWIMLLSKIILLIMSLSSGAFLIWVCLPSAPMISLTLNLKWLALNSLGLGVLLGVLLCLNNMKGLTVSLNMKMFSPILWMWNLALLSSMKLSAKSMNMSLNLYLDLGWLEMLGGQGVNYLVLNLGNTMELLAFNSVKKVLIMFSIVLLILVIAF
uniref:NADH-ubiquinone oxidoreductase chain 5 n=1 Tax=Armadillidium album TaxID=96802 RepID=A0A1P8DKK6_9CRUS|nr:NADH dehydrogenase subunit 5 [Armadillidium album]